MLQQILSEPSGKFSDGSALYYYDNNLNCSWLIRPAPTEEHTWINLRFDWIETQVQKIATRFLILVYLIVF
jgi:hypothetical protein